MHNGNVSTESLKFYPINGGGYAAEDASFIFEVRPWASTFWKMTISSQENGKAIFERNYEFLCGAKKDAQKASRFESLSVLK
jgi:hypothetical protein